MRARSPFAPAGRPSTETEPPATRCTPTTARMSVVLPLPLGPSRPVTDPWATSHVSSGRTMAPPRTTRRRSTRIAGSVLIHVHVYHGCPRIDAERVPIVAAHMLLYTPEADALRAA